jgi:cytochrome c oxidase subunit 4
MEPHTHVVSPRVYVGIFVALMVLTAVTTAVAFVDLGPLNVVIMLVIAFLKASLVVLFFMHARYESQLTRMTILGAVFWLFVLISISASDVFIRFRPDAVAPLGLRTETAAVMPTPAPHPPEQPGAGH